MWKETATSRHAPVLQHIRHGKHVNAGKFLEFCGEIREFKNSFAATLVSAAKAIKWTYDQNSWSFTCPSTARLVRDFGSAFLTWCQILSHCWVPAFFTPVLFLIATVNCDCVCFTWKKRRPLLFCWVLAAALYTLAPSVKPVIPHFVLCERHAKILDFNTSCKGPLHWN